MIMPRVAILFRAWQLAWVQSLRGQRDKWKDKAQREVAPSQMSKDELVEAAVKECCIRKEVAEAMTKGELKLDILEVRKLMKQKEWLLPSKMSEKGKKELQDMCRARGKEPGEWIRAKMLDWLKMWSKCSDYLGEVATEDQVETFKAQHLDPKKYTVNKVSISGTSPPTAGLPPAGSTETLVASAGNAAAGSHSSSGMPGEDWLSVEADMLESAIHSSEAKETLKQAAAQSMLQLFMNGTTAETVLAQAMCTPSLTPHLTPQEITVIFMSVKQCYTTLTLSKA